MRYLFEVLLCIESLLCTLIEDNQILNRWRIIQIIRELIIEFSNQHPELCPPVPQMIHSKHFMSKEF
jgi:hypothetical protein